MSGDSKTSNEHESDGYSNDNIIAECEIDDSDDKKKIRIITWVSIHIVSNHLC